MALDTALRRMGHDVIGMEHYVAEGATPLEKCLADVRSADVYVVIVAWRYGYQPKESAVNPLRRSITELEYAAAKETGKSILAFLLDPTAPWPTGYVDALTESGGTDVQRFRATLGSKYLAGIFRTADNLASQAAAAVAAQGMTRHMAERALEQEDVTARMNPFITGGGLQDTAFQMIREMVATAGTTRAVLVQMGTGNTWWSTRLYLLATLLQSLTGVRQLVFAHSTGRFAGMASPAAVREGLSAAFPQIAAFDTTLRTEPSTQDTDREIDRCINLWQAQLQADEANIKVGVRWQLVSRWLGERLVTRCISVDPDGLTMLQVQQIVESLIPDVPVERANPLPTEPEPGQARALWQLMVVDRDGFALELAREWVRTGLPGTRILG
jgi:hypothetical protein